MNKVNVCIFGAGGQLGSKLVESFVKNDLFNIYAIDKTFNKKKISHENLKYFSLDIQNPLENELKKITFNNPDLPIICNFTAVAENNPLKLKENIINQVTNKVRWKETMEYALDKKINKVLECGSGKVLSGLFKRFSKDFNVSNIETIEDLKNIEI